MKILVSDRFDIVAVMEGNDCPAEDFIFDGEESTLAARAGLSEMLQKIAQMGLDEVPSAWSHEANKQKKILELIKGPLRLFFFKGKNNQIVVATIGARKTSSKANQKAVSRSAKWKEKYDEAIFSETLETVREINQ